MFYVAGHRKEAEGVPGDLGVGCPFRLGVNAASTLPVVPGASALSCRAPPPSPYPPKTPLALMCPTFQLGEASLRSVALFPTQAAPHSSRCSLCSVGGTPRPAGLSPELGKGTGAGNAAGSH